MAEIGRRRLNAADCGAGGPHQDAFSPPLDPSPQDRQLRSFLPCLSCSASSLAGDASPSMQPLLLACQFPVEPSPSPAVRRSWRAQRKCIPRRQRRLPGLDAPDPPHAYPFRRLGSPSPEKAQAAAPRLRKQHLAGPRSFRSDSACSQHGGRRCQDRPVFDGDDCRRGIRLAGRSHEKQVAGIEGRAGGDAR